MKSGIQSDERDGMEEGGNPSRSETGKKKSKGNVRIVCTLK
jgi:hypothetical protein